MEDGKAGIGRKRGGAARLGHSRKDGNVVAPGGRGHVNVLAAGGKGEEALRKDAAHTKGAGARHGLRGGELSMEGD